MQINNSNSGIVAGANPSHHNFKDSEAHIFEINNICFSFSLLPLGCVDAPEFYYNELAFHGYNDNQHESLDYII